MPEPVRAVQKAVALLHAFDREHRVLTVRELAELTGVPRSTCHALAQTLVDAQLLERYGAEGYRLGTGLATLGGQVLERTGLVDAAVEQINLRLTGTQSEIHVAQVVPTGIVYVLRVINGRRLPNHNRTGRHWPLHGSACGLATLAALPPDERTAYLAGLEPEGAARSQKSLDIFQRTGYVVTGVAQSGFTSVGAPILGAGGVTIGAIGTAEGANYVTQRRVRELGEAIAQSAAAISATLGYGRRPD